MINLKKVLFTALLATSSLFIACSSDDDSGSEPQVIDNSPKFFVGVEGTDGKDVLAPAESLTEGVITPINNGIVQPAWMTFVNLGDAIVAQGFSSDNEMKLYKKVNGELQNTDNLFTTLAPFAMADAGDNNFIAVASAREGNSDREIYLIDKSSFAITKTVQTKIDEITAEDLIAFPTGVAVNGNKLFITYYFISTGTGGSSAAIAKEAKIAVYSYPELNFEKIITDDRSPSLGVYAGTGALIKADNGDLYTYSSASSICGFIPAPASPSSILRIKNGTSDFDTSYHFDFQTVSGGYKINDMLYAGNGKAIVRMFQEPPVVPQEYFWAAYAPTIDQNVAALTLGVVDLEAKTVTPIDGIPAHGGAWGIANLVRDGKVYINISHSNEAAVYVIDPETATAEKGATIQGNYAKGIFYLD
ncbi:DUF4374 domain-containing protein [Aquimarina rhabdastrellae]